MNSSTSLRVRTNFLYGLGSHLACNGLMALAVYYMVVQMSASQARELLGWIVPIAQACCFFAALALAFGLAIRDARSSGCTAQSVRGWMIRRILPFGTAARKAFEPVATLSRKIPAADIEAAVALIKAIEWRAFKAMTVAYYHELGFRVLDQLRCSESIDFLAYRHTDCTVIGVRCVPRGTARISLKIVRDFHFAIRLAGARRGVMVTTAAIDEAALDFCDRNDLELLDERGFASGVLSLPPEAARRLLSG